MAITYYNKGNSIVGNNSRRRSYGLMLFLGFGAALLGVLILHKLRERRIYNLVLKQKDQDFFSLKLLFQKEKDYSQEVKRLNEEMSAEIFTLENQKLELDRKLLEMQSAIDSLQGKLKTMEVAFKEKQKEIKLLIESLKQKETDIEELKCQLENPKKVLSVSLDDPLRLNPEGNGNRRETIERKAEKLQNVQNENANAETKSSFGNEISVANSTDSISYYSSRDVDSKKLTSRANGDDENHGTTKAGMNMNLEIQNYSDNGHNIKGKRWRTIAKNRSDKDGQGGFKSRVKRMSFKRKVSRYSDDSHPFEAGKTGISSNAKSLETLKTENSVNTTTSEIVEETKSQRENSSK